MAAAAASASASAASCFTAVIFASPTVSHKSSRSGALAFPQRTFHLSAVGLFSSSSSSSSSVRLRFSPLPVKATTSEESSTEVSAQLDDVLSDLKSKWDSIENKSNVFVYGGGALVSVWLSSVIVGAINSVPLLPKLMELVGLGYTGWFVYRYLLFKESRQELVSDIKELKDKITGANKDE
eukprot:c11656_g1_i1 orf=193-735(+)